MATFTYDATDPAGFLLRWSRYLAAAPRELTSFLFLNPGRGDPGPVAQAISVWAGDDVDAAVATLEPMLGLAPVLDQRAQLVPYPALVPPSDIRHSGQQRIRTRTGFLARPSKADTEALERLLADPAVVVLEVRSVGAAVGDVDRAATAFAHRTQEIFVSAWGAPGRDDALDAAWSVVTPRLNGMYAAYSSDTRPELARVAYPGATYDRLAHMKRRYDPDNVFHRGITIDPAGPEPATLGPNLSATG